MTVVQSSLRGFKLLCQLLGEPIEPHMLKIARAVIEGPEREIGVSVGRGNSKTTTAALIGLHHLLSAPGASVTVGAASRDQGRIAFERMKGFAQHPAIAESLTVRHLELRGPEGALLRVIPSDGPRAHGLSSGLYVGDELWAWPDKGLLEAMQTGLIKRPDARLLLISTAPAQADSPWGRMRTRALGQRDVRQRGVFTEARGALHWLEWSAPADARLDDYRLAAKVNPASRFTPAVMREARARVPPAVYAQFHLNQLGAAEAGWLPPGAWAACIGEPVFESGESVYIGVDAAGPLTAVVWVQGRHVSCEVFTGDAGPLDARDLILELAERHDVREISSDLWRVGPIMAELERAGLPVVATPATDARQIPASARLREAVLEQRLILPDHLELSAAAARAVTRQVRRGWRLDGDSIAPLLALALAVDSAEAVQPEPVKLLGWL